MNEELRQALPKAVINAMQQPSVIKGVTDSLAQKLSPRIEAEMIRVMQTSLAPMLESLGRTTQKVESDMERHLQAQIKYYEAQRQADNAKIEEMSNMLRGLSQTIASLAANQGHPSPQREVQREVQREAQNVNVNVNKRASVGRPSGNQARMPQQQQPVLQPVPIPQAAPPLPLPLPLSRHLLLGLPKKPSWQISFIVSMPAAMRKALSRFVSVSLSHLIFY